MRRVNKLSGSWETGKIQPGALKHSLKAGNWWCISCLFLCRPWMSELTEAACGWIFYNRMCNLIVILFTSWFSTNLPVDLTLPRDSTRLKPRRTNPTFLAERTMALDLEMLIFILSVSPDYKPKTVMVRWGKQKQRRPFQGGNPSN